MQRVAAKEIQNQGVEFVGSFKIRHVAALIEYIKVGVRYLFSGEACVPDGKEAVLSPPDDEGRNLYVIEIVYDGVEYIRACAVHCRTGPENRD